MLHDEYGQAENLFRAVHQHHWDSEKNSPTSATFKDSGGCSVDKQAGRSIETSSQVLIDRLPHSKAVVHLTCEETTTAGATIRKDETPGNPFHSLILHTDNTIPIKSAVAKKLVKSVKISIQVG